mmetsp:Transcript_21150/g.41893  ORF Transcript_21150/g.41893 Transcript_21150/m.41893 type:complete len:403 (-) Transcript_21150:111-1319(-)
MTSTASTQANNEKEISNDFGLSLFFGEIASTETPLSETPSAKNPTNESTATEITTTTIPTTGSPSNTSYSVDDGYSTTYKCSSKAVVTNGDEYREDESGVDMVSLILEEVVEFDYDILLTNMTDIKAVLTNFEKKLLDYVGSELIGVGCSLRNRKQRATKGTLIRRSLVDAAGAIDVTEISSEPQDEVSIDDDASCAENNESSPSDGTVCYPVTGYMTVYYSSFDSANSEKERIELNTQEIIARGMSSGDFADEYLLAVNFIGIRGEKDTQQLETSTKPNQVSKAEDLSSSSHIYLLIGVIVVAAVATIFATLLVYKRLRQVSKETVEEIVNEDSLENEENSTTNEHNAQYDDSSELCPACSVESDEETEVASNVRSTNLQHSLPSGIANQPITESDEDGDY